MEMHSLDGKNDAASRFRDGMIFGDDFNDAHLDEVKWCPYYLPHWASSETRACFQIENSVLRLSIARDQQPWCPEFDGKVRVSGLQTGHFSGPAGSGTGQHKFRDDLKVRRTLPEKRLFVPQYCRLETRVRVQLNPWNLAALWLIGFEDMPEKSGEITVFELFGDRIGSSHCSVSRGIKKINDPLLEDEIDDGVLPIDVEAWHVYAMDWRPSGVEFHVDGESVMSTCQSPSYPMQIMVNLYDLRKDDPLLESGRDAWCDIDYVRAYLNTD